MLFYFRKENFTFRGCSWKATDHDMRTWTDENKNRIKVVPGLFEEKFGGDFLLCYYDDTYGTKVDYGAFRASYPDISLATAQSI